ncbi:MAG: hypothetical protein HY074_19500 [Deltaproteobacteria bacterium]|nr:hypothetical protein [Deltaproteobacteria bacterium]
MRPLIFYAVIICMPFAAGIAKADYYEFRTTHSGAAKKKPAQDDSLDCQIDVTYNDGNIRCQSHFDHKIAFQLEHVIGHYGPGYYGPDGAMHAEKDWFVTIGFVPQPMGYQLADRGRYEAQNTEELKKIREFYAALLARKKVARAEQAACAVTGFAFRVEVTTKDPFGGFDAILEHLFQSEQNAMGFMITDAGLVEPHIQVDGAVQKRRGEWKK